MLLFFDFFNYFFRNFLTRVEYERNSGLKFRFHFFGLSHPVLAKNNDGKKFYNFFNIFFGIFLPGSSMNGIRDKIFFFSLCRFISSRFVEFFYNFFWNFLGRVEFERNSGLKLCFPFFGRSHPLLAENNAGMRFYNFLNFFTILFGIFMPGLSINGIRD